MLIHGGTTFRHNNINQTRIRIFDMCEYYDEKYSVEAE